MNLLLDHLLVPSGATLRTALSVMDRNGAGVLFAVDGAKHFDGILTDGDIRRAILRGVDLDVPVASIVRPHAVTLPVDASQQTILAALSDRIRIIPLLDEHGRVVDYASRYRYHHLPVTEPSLEGNELDYIIECIDTNWLSSKGPFVLHFEDGLKRYVGTPHALAVCNGTAALHLALAGLGIGPGDEVIVPDLTFAATINAVLFVGATPVIVDVNRETWTIEPTELERAIGSRTKALLPVHLYGQPCDMTALMQIASRHDLLVIEDAAEALGARYLEQPVGSFGDAAAFSFYGNKLITTGEGGMVMFRDPDAADHARRLRDHGMDPDRRYWHPEIGFNYRLTNLQAAVGVAQLERLEEFVARKQHIGASYTSALRGEAGLVLPADRRGCSNVYWLYSMVVKPDIAGVTRDDLMDRLLLGGIETRSLFYPLHEMPPYRSFAKHGSYPNSTWLARNGLSLPSAVTLKDDDIRHVVDAVRRVLHFREISRLT